MAELIKKAYLKNAIGVTQSAKLYTTLTEVNNQGIPVTVDGTRCYLRYGNISDPQATSARVKFLNDETKAILSQAQIPYGSQTYNSTGIFTIPTGVTRIKVTVKGAGGGRGGNAYYGYGWDTIGYGGPGGAGGLNVQVISVVPYTSLQVVVGLKGSDGKDNTLDYFGDGGNRGGAGTAGGTSSISSVAATGGGGGTYGYIYENSGNEYLYYVGVNGSRGADGTPVGNGAAAGTNGSVLIEWGGDIV